MKQISSLSSVTNLRSSFLIMSMWAERFKIKDFPSSLDSLKLKNPSDNLINTDISVLNRFAKHPSYVYFRTGYLPITNCKEN